MKLGLRELTFFVLLLAIPVGAWWFVFKPRSLRVAEETQQIEAKRAKLAALNYATAGIGDLEHEIEELTQAVAFFQDKLPQQEGMPLVLQETWRLAEANDLTAKAIRTQALNSGVQVTDPSGPYAEQPILMELEGDFAGLYSFLLELENKPRITRIHQMRLEKDAQAEGRMRAQMVMSIFYERNGH